MYNYRFPISKVKKSGAYIRISNLCLNLYIKTIFSHRRQCQQYGTLQKTPTQMSSIVYSISQVTALLYEKINIRLIDTVSSTLPDYELGHSALMHFHNLYSRLRAQISEHISREFNRGSP